VLLCLLLVPITPKLPATIASATANAAPARFGNLPGSQPALFIANVGQLDAGVRFQVRSQHSTLFLTDDAIWLTVVDPQTLAAPPQQRTGASSQPVAAGEPLRGITAPALRGVNLKLSFVGSNTHLQLEPFARSATHFSFFRGDQASWRADVPVWGGVRYRNLYPGIDLELSGAHGQIEQRLYARPEADLSVVRLRVDGAEAQTIASDFLRLQTAAGEVALPLLQVQSDDAMSVGSSRPEPEIDGTNVRAPFARSNTAASAPAAQNALGIGYSTLFGGTFDDTAADLAVGSDGAAYITGSTFSPDFPTTPGAFDESCGNDEDQTCNYDGKFYYYDTIVTKLNPTGTERVYATFIGGQNGEFGNSIAIDASGAAYITGKTFSPDFPTTARAFDRNCGADGTCSYDSTSGYFADGFVAKLNPTGTSLSYATFLGDLNDDWGNAIVVDSAGAAYITGVTHSPDFPTTTGAFDRNCGTDGTCSYDSSANTVRPDAFITKLNPAGTAPIYSTFLGGSNNDRGFDIAVDQSGEAYLTGNTISDDLPTTVGAYDRACGTDDTCDFDGNDTVYYDAFVAKINVAGTALVYATYLGGKGGDGGFAITLDQAKAAYITGYTFSLSGFPSLPNSFDPSFNGLKDAFVTKLDPAGTALIYSTFLGGSDSDDGRNIVVDSGGSAYITGLTFSTNFPTTQNGYDASFNGADDAFVAQLDPAGTQMTYSTFLGGESADEGYGIGLGSDNNLYVGGLTSSANFPITTGAVYTKATCGSEPSTHACYDIFVVRLASVSAAPEHTRVFLPLSMRLTAIAPDPLCDAYEPNNSRVNSSTPLDLGTTITAKICQKEGLAQPDNLYQDNYRVSTPQPRPLQIKLALPQSLVVHVALAVYDAQALVNPINGCYIDEVRATPFTLNCKIPDAGAYVVRLYSWDGFSEDTQPYTLLVTQ
jgi:hypothetical protein